MPTGRDMFRVRRNSTKPVRLLVSFLLGLTRKPTQATNLRRMIDRASSGSRPQDVAVSSPLVAARVEWPSAVARLEVLAHGHSGVLADESALGVNTWKLVLLSGRGHVLVEAGRSVWARVLFSVALCLKDRGRP